MKQTEGEKKITRSDSRGKETEEESERERREKHKAKMRSEIFGSLHKKI